MVIRILQIINYRSTGYCQSPLLHPPDITIGIIGTGHIRAVTNLYRKVRLGFKEGFTATLTELDNLLQTLKN